MTEQPANIDDSALSEAMRLIDPTGMLVPSSEAYQSVREMVLGWIDGCGPDYAIDMARKGAKHLDIWVQCQ